MPKKTNCCKCGKYGKVTWANYAPYCSECIAEKSKHAISFEDAMKIAENSEDHKFLEELKEILVKDYNNQT